MSGSHPRAFSVVTWPDTWWTALGTLSKLSWERIVGAAPQLISIKYALRWLIIFYLLTAGCIQLYHSAFGYLCCTMKRCFDRRVLTQLAWLIAPSQLLDWLFPYPLIFGALFRMLSIGAWCRKFGRMSPLSLTCYSIALSRLSIKCVFYSCVYFSCLSLFVTRSIVRKISKNHGPSWQKLGLSLRNVHFSFQQICCFEKKMSSKCKCFQTNRLKCGLHWTFTVTRHLLAAHLVHIWAINFIFLYKSMIGKSIRKPLFVLKSWHSFLIDRNRAGRYAAILRNESFWLIKPN